ncbi:hypothetical protein DPMN_192626 [Dreissena polymorpha]|uniref:Uncharacterized protein n=1 Tax=Dreissena polymorpha TaxID=45954 RepID=A0A9D3Y3K1_DREPO|nr:hypothetical protein DPMN_192626 [Dreissena polymorpha]
MLQEMNLFHGLHDALQRLRSVISSKRLPYYMIPERYLMEACGLQTEQQRKWVADITDMMKEGPRVILRWSKIRKAVISHPEPLLWFSRRKLEFEILGLELITRLTRCGDENGKIDCSDNLLLEITRRHSEVQTEVIQRMIMEGSIVCDPIDGLRGMLAILRRLSEGI